MTQVRVRFAPSPTGHIHIGNARTALLNWCFAKKQGGAFILRFDDTDVARSKQEYVDGIREDLKWLGIVPDEEERQSLRIDAYNAAVDHFKAQGRIYACYETQDELDRKRKRQLARGLPPVYDRAGLKVTDDERAAFEKEGRKPYWRFLLSEETAQWHDLVRGAQQIDLKSLSDPVVMREDGSFLYTFTSVIDDADMGITHVIRGEDHVTNTAAQIDIFKALNKPVPIFAHHNLLTTADGEGLSKRLGHLSLRSLRENGLEAMAVACLAVLIGSAESVVVEHTLDALAQHVDLSRLSRAPAKFDAHELENLSHATLHSMPYAIAKPRLDKLEGDVSEAFWLAVRANLNRLDDVVLWHEVATKPCAPLIEENEGPYLSQAAALLPGGTWDGQTWGAWTKALSAESGRKGKDLFMPLRKALTGRDKGPDLAQFLPFIGRERTLARLGGQHA